MHQRANGRIEQAGIGRDGDDRRWMLWTEDDGDEA